MTQTQAAVDDQIIRRGLCWHLPSTPRGLELARKAANHTITAQEIIRAIEPLGIWWGMESQYGGVAEYESHAESDFGVPVTLALKEKAEEEAEAQRLDPDKPNHMWRAGPEAWREYVAERQADVRWFGGDMALVFTAKRPMRGGELWDPAEHNPAGTLWSGNSYLEQGQNLEIIEVRYDAGDGWRTLSVPGGIRTTAMPVAPTPELRFEVYKGQRKTRGVSSPGVTWVYAYVGDEMVGWLGFCHTVLRRGTSYEMPVGEIYDVKVDEAYRRRGIATALLAKARRIEPRVHHSWNLTEDGRGWSQRAAMAPPSWRDRGDRPQAEALIVPDQGRGRRNSYEVYLYGQPHARRGSLEKAKFAVEEIYGTQVWTKIEGDRKTHYDPVWGHTSMFNDADHFYVVDRLPRLGATASTEELVFERKDLWNGMEPEEYRRLYGSDPKVDGFDVSFRGKHIGGISWWLDTKVVSSIVVKEEYQRRGFATAIWRKALEVEPDLRHDTRQVSDAGRAWIQSLAKVADLEHWRPTSGMFARGSDTLDPRLFDTQTEEMLPAVQQAIMATLDAYWTPKYGQWQQWAKVYLAGSGASYWWDSDADLDILIGVDLERLREARPANREVSDEDILAHLNKGLQTDLRPTTTDFLGQFEATWFVNAGAYDIRALIPYAAYDVGLSEWVVKPPVLPKDWGPHMIPDEIWRRVEQTIRSVQKVLSLPEPERTLAGTVMFNAVHEERRASYSAHGGGWLSYGNVAYQALQQHPQRLLRQIFLCKHPEDRNEADVFEKVAEKRTIDMTPPMPDGWKGNGIYEMDISRFSSTGCVALLVDAMGMVFPVGWLTWDRERHTVEGIWVNEDYRGKGIGIEMLKEAEKVAGHSLKEDSGEYTPEGFAWAKKRGINPKMKERVSASDMARMIARMNNLLIGGDLLKRQVKKVGARTARMAPQRFAGFEGPLARRFDSYDDQSQRDIMAAVRALERGTLVEPPDPKSGALRGFYTIPVGAKSESSTSERLVVLPTRDGWRAVYYLPHHNYEQAERDIGGWMRSLSRQGMSRIPDPNWVRAFFGTGEANYEANKPYVGVALAGGFYSRIGVPRDNMKVPIPWEGDVARLLPAAERAAEQFFSSSDYAANVIAKGDGQYALIIGSNLNSRVVAVSKEIGRWQPAPRGEMGEVETWPEFLSLMRSSPQKAWEKVCVEIADAQPPGFNSHPAFDPAKVKKTLIYRGMTLKEGEDPQRSVKETTGGVGSSWTLDLNTAKAIAERGGAGFTNANSEIGKVHQWKGRPRPFTKEHPVVLRAEVDLTKDGVALFTDGRMFYVSEQEVDVAKGTEINITGIMEAEKVFDRKEKAEAERLADLAERTGGDEGDFFATYSGTYRWGSFRQMRQTRTANMAYYSREWRWQAWAERNGYGSLLIERPLPQLRKMVEGVFRDHGITAPLDISVGPKGLGYSEGQLKDGRAVITINADEKNFWNALHEASHIVCEHKGMDGWDNNHGPGFIEVFSEVLEVFGGIDRVNVGENPPERAVARR